jgi:hypothetical protein
MPTSGRQVSEWRIVLLLFGVTLLVLGTIWVGVSYGDERPAETRVDLFDKSSNRTGYATIDRTGRIDRFDTHGRRQDGYGTIDRSGSRVDTFDGKGQRKGYGTTNGSRGGRR